MAEQIHYSQYEKEWNRLKQKEENRLQLAKGFRAADIYLNRNYLDHFSAAPILPASRRTMDISKIRMVEITKIVFDEDEKFTDKLMSVYSALYGMNSSIALILNSDGNTVHFYMGTRAEDNIAVAGDILESSLKGNFPGILYESLDAVKTADVIARMKDQEIKSMASVSVVPSVRDKDMEAESFVQGLEKFIDTMNGKIYTMVCLATPLDAMTVQKRKHGYEELCSSLSPHSKLSVSYGENESLAVNRGISTSFSESVNRSVSTSNTTSSSNSSGTNSSRNSGSSFSGNFSDGGGGFGWGSNSGYSDGAFDSYTSGNSFTESVSDSAGKSSSESSTKGETKTSGNTKSITLNFENNGVCSLIERAKAQLERFKAGESFGMWEFSSYFLSKDIHTTVLAGNVYKALMTGKESNVESAHINIWPISQRESVRKIMDYIFCFQHPLAEMQSFEGGGKQQIAPTNLVSGNELPLVMGFPKKSVSGMAVVEMAEFGRAVVYENKKPKKSIDFGNIYHMGVVENARVKMDLDLLASHCFITGSSGSGKSYATYQLLEEVLQKDIKMMIIEPAKGEYKQVFGGLRGIKIFTTDPNTYRILRINPFQFPDNIHLLSHIEQLLQIFNAAWPLYAAMPAILKQAVVEAYIKCGWDVQNSIWIAGISDHKYPVFADVLDILPGIINTSDYSADSKGDYKGALLTRVQSMTVGINGVIFKNSMGIEDSLLFDSNTIIDLSELGSDEAIALIMGVVIMKLNEYRKSQRKSDKKFAMNSGLRHLTVLEEAHNLLKRTSKEQNQEGANMVGKSVEMISNSIKEMRTYGEGFLIIDQSPMAVDTSAIENTATKIILNTPAKDACEELGSALSLNERQTRELSRLNVGVAAVYQKGWLAPVLMKVDVWNNQYEVPVEIVDQSSLRMLRGKLVEELLEEKRNNKFSPIKMRTIVRESELTVDKKREIDEIIADYNNKFASGAEINNYEFGMLLTELIGCESLFAVIPTDGIPTYEEFLEYESDSEEFYDLKQRFEKGVERWFIKMFDALTCYVTIRSEEIRTETIIYLVYVAGAAGQLRDNRKDRMAMLCRMLYRMFHVEMR